METNIIYILYQNDFTFKLYYRKEIYFSAIGNLYEDTVIALSTSRLQYVSITLTHEGEMSRSTIFCNPLRDILMV